MAEKKNDKHKATHAHIGATRLFPDGEIDMYDFEIVLRNLLSQGMDRGLWFTDMTKELIKVSLTLRADVDNDPDRMFKFLKDSQIMIEVAHELWRERRVEWLKDWPEDLKESFRYKKDIEPLRREWPKDGWPDDFSRFLSK